VAGRGRSPNARQWLVAALVAIWSLRLGSHIAERTAKITDDPRYAAFAKEWGVDSREKCSSFAEQGFGSIRWCFDFVAARFPGHALRLQDYAGALILFIRHRREALADAQLKSFRKNSANKGRVCDIGLWRWSRHPNYFFEWFGWLAYPVIAISTDYPLSILGLATLLAPASCTGSWCTSPASAAGAQMLRSRGARYRDYQSRTSSSFHCRRKERSHEFRFLDHRTAERVPLPTL